MMKTDSHKNGTIVTKSTFLRNTKDATYKTNEENM